MSGSWRWRWRGTVMPSRCGRGETPPSLPDVTWLADAVQVRHVDAGPPRPAPEPERVPHLPTFAAALRAAWGRDRPDVVHAHSWTSGMAALAATPRRRSTDGANLPLTGQRRAAGPRRGQRQPGRADPGGARHRPGRRPLVATSTGQADELTPARRGAPADPGGAARGGRDEFTPDGPALPRGNRPRVVHAGRLLSRRGVDETVAALAAVPDAELVLAGDFGPGHRDRARLEALADRYGVRDRLQVVEPLPRARMPGAAPLGRRRGVRAVVRTVRRGGAGGHGLRPAGGGQRGRRAHRHRGGRGDRGARRRRVGPPSWRRRCAACSAARR